MSEKAMKSSDGMERGFILLSTQGLLQAISSHNQELSWLVFEKTKCVVLILRIVEVAKRLNAPSKVTGEIR